MITPKMIGTTAESKDLVSVMRMLCDLVDSNDPNCVVLKIIDKSVKQVKQSLVEIDGQYSEKTLVDSIALSFLGLGILLGRKELTN